MKKNIYCFIPYLFAISLVACGGGGNGGDDGIDTGSSPDVEVATIPDLQSSTRNEKVILSGVLVDAGPVSGLSYETDTQSGITNELGQFQYSEGEGIQFSLGGQSIGNSVVAGPILTTTALAGASEDNPDPFINTTRLLQTLDVDGNPDNGIQISPAAATAVMDNGLSLDIDQSIMEFEMDADVLTLVINGDQENTPSELIASDVATNNSVTTIVNSYLIGAWNISLPSELDEDEDSLHTYLILLPNKSFVFANITKSDFDGSGPCGNLGLETGTYSSTTDTLQLTAAFDTNGCKGLFDNSDGEVTGKTIDLSIISTSANEMVVQFLDDEPIDVTLNRAVSSSSDLTGLWQEDGLNAFLQFLPNGIFYFIEDPAITDSGEPFIEIARYDFDATEATINLEFLASSESDSTIAGDTLRATNVELSETKLHFLVPEDDDSSVSLSRVTAF